MPERVDAFIDYSSPFAYLGSTQVERVVREAGGEVRFRPFLLGALFKAIGTPTIPIEAMSEAKRVYMRTDMERWAAHYGVGFVWNQHFPVRTVDALRVTLVAPESQRASLVHSIMRAVWVDDEDPSDLGVLARCLERAGADAALLDRRSEAKEQLFAATEEARALGVPGAPTFVVGEDLFWGQDRLDFVARRLRGWRAPVADRRMVEDS